jgi:hypothetical protein
MERILDKIISEQFCQSAKCEDFERLLLRRDGVTFKNKIDIVCAMLPLFSDQPAAQKLKSVLTNVEKFRVKRNAFAHGMDVTPVNNPAGGVCIELMGRSGKGKVLSVSPKSHDSEMAEAENILNELLALRVKLCA